MGNYEQTFEEIEDRAIVISDLIEQIILVDDVIARHKEAGSHELQIQQYIDRRNEFKEALNTHLGVVNLMLVEKKVA